MAWTAPGPPLVKVLIDGVFNADPHPGNILYVAPGSRGGGLPRGEQLGLIDYGQVGGWLVCIWMCIWMGSWVCGWRGEGHNAAS